MAKITPQLLSEINEALDNLRWGSVEIYVQDDNITQTTIKNIKKTSVSIQEKVLEKSKNGNKVLTNKKQTSINDYNNLR